MRGGPPALHEHRTLLHQRDSLCCANVSLVPHDGSAAFVCDQQPQPGEFLFIFLFPSLLPSLPSCLRCANLLMAPYNGAAAFVCDQQVVPFLMLCSYKSPVFF